MSDVVLGIDLGTSNSVVSVSLEDEHIVIPDENGNRIQPSLVYFFPDGRVVIGNEAKQYLMSDPEHTVYSAKRLIGRPFDSPEIKMLLGSFPFPIAAADDGSSRINMHGVMHSPEGISGRILKYLKGLAEDYLGHEITKTVITVPANFDEGQRRATKRAGELAGLEVLRLVNEPTAAALAYGYGADKRERVAIYDFGGGTFDVTILELRGDVFQVLATAGNSYLGGDDFDNRLVESMLTAFEKQHGIDLSGDTIISHRLKSIAQGVKHQLSGEKMITASVAEMVPGSIDEVELEFSLTQSAFEKRTADLVRSSLSTCEDALGLAGLQRAEIDHLVLVGGTTKTPYVQRNVEEFFNRTAVMNINPDEVVSVGAAIFGQSLVAPAEAPSTDFQPDLDAEHFADESWLVADLEEQSSPPPVPINSTLAGGLGGMAAIAPRPSLPSPSLPKPSLPRPSLPNPSLASPSLPSPSLPSPSLPIPSLPAMPGAASTYDSVSAEETQQMDVYNPPVPKIKAPPRRSGPVLIDVTPHAIGIATIGGVMDIIIERNGSIPLQRSRQFSTSRDDQTRVVLPIYSGNSRRIEENQQLGVLELLDIEPGPREETKIEVTLEVDTSGMLHIFATDLRTGREQAAKISILGESNDPNQYNERDLLS